MKDIVESFCDTFPSIDFDIRSKEVKHQLSIESTMTGEKQIRKMLADAKRALSRIKKAHKHGKSSSEEVFDHEFRVHELQEQLERFRDFTSDLDLDEEI